MSTAFWTHTVEILVIVGVAFLLGLLLGYLLWGRCCKKPASVKPDDLKKIEGIGPKIEKLCNSAGIHTWQQLANTSIESLRQMIDNAGADFRVADPTTWPKQAGLAAAGKWDELRVYQDRLIGGREPV